MNKKKFSILLESTSLKDQACTETLLTSNEFLCNHVTQRFSQVFGYIQEQGYLSSQDMVTCPKLETSGNKMEWLIETLASKDRQAFHGFIDALAASGNRKISSDLQLRMEEALTNLTIEEGNEEAKFKNKPSLFMRLFSKLAACSLNISFS